MIEALKEELTQEQKKREFDFLFQNNYLNKLQDKRILTLIRLTN